MNDHEILLTGRGALSFRFDPPRVLESTLTIPRTLHMVWIGETRIPYRYEANVRDFAEHNPEWDVRLWENADVAPVVADMRNRDLFEAETNIAAKVDLLRYELVYQHGGVYLDADTLSLGPGSLERMSHAFLTVSGPPWYNTGNAQFGFAKGSEFLEYVIEHLRDSRVRARWEIPERTGPTYLTTCALSFNDWRIVHPNGAELLSKVRHLAEKNW
jgi:mannosyltransferase OCH1-like enzyme